MASQGIERLYTHQVQAIEALRGGLDVVVVTGTASGKSLCYHLPVLERLLADPEATALYLFPTKALTQDQLKGLTRLASGHPDILRRLLAGVYDGKLLQLFVDGKLAGTKEFAGRARSNAFPVMVGNNAEHPERRVAGWVSPSYTPATRRRRDENEKMALKARDLRLFFCFPQVGFRGRGSLQHRAPPRLGIQRDSIPNPVFPFPA